MRAETKAFSRRPSTPAPGSPAGQDCPHGKATCPCARLIERTGASPVAQRLPRPFKQDFAAEPFAIRRAMRRIRHRFARQLNPEVLNRLELVLAEICNNIAEHGYGPEDGGAIRLSVSAGRQGLNCAVEDCGRAVPPCCLAPDRTCAPPTGGSARGRLRLAVDP